MQREVTLREGVNSNDQWVAVTVIGGRLHIPAGRRNSKLSWLISVMLMIRIRQCNGDAN